MSFATLANIATMLFCLAVLVQSVRMMRSLKTVRDGALTEVVATLDRSTLQARKVLSELRETLRGDASTIVRTVAEGRAMADELSIMIGVADVSAERIVDAVATTRPRRRRRTKTAAPAEAGS